MALRRSCGIIRPRGSPSSSPAATTAPPPTPVRASKDPWPFYPASSRYVLGVGGTRFSPQTITTGWPGEVAWQYVANGTDGDPDGSGGGYWRVFIAPAWQVAPGFNNVRRGVPDISAVGNADTGYYICYGNSSACAQYGGTSLSAPLWAGMLAVTNSYLVAQGKTPVGFVNPMIYQLPNTAQPFAPYNDITGGNNGVYSCAAGWDPVTGLGTPDLWNFARNVAAASTGAATATAATTTPVPGATNTPVVATNTSVPAPSNTHPSPAPATPRRRRSRRRRQPPPAPPARSAMCRSATLLFLHHRAGQRGDDPAATATAPSGR